MTGLHRDGRSIRLESPSDTSPGPATPLRRHQAGPDGTPADRAGGSRCNMRDALLAESRHSVKPPAASCKPSARGSAAWWVPSGPSIGRGKSSVRRAVARAGGVRQGVRGDVAPHRRSRRARAAVGCGPTVSPCGSPTWWTTPLSAHRRRAREGLHARLPPSRSARRARCSASSNLSAREIEQPRPRAPPDDRGRRQPDRAIHGTAPGGGGLRASSWRARGGTHRRRGSRAACRILAEAERLLASSLDFETTLSTLAALAVPDPPTGALSTSSSRRSIRRIAVAPRGSHEADLARTVARLGRRPAAGLHGARACAPVARSCFPTSHGGWPRCRRGQPRALRGDAPARLPLVHDRAARGARTIVRALTFVTAELVAATGRWTVARAGARRPGGARGGQRAVSSVEAQEALTQAERANAPEDEFLATVSHELRTPLSAVLLWTRPHGPRSLDEGRRRAPRPEIDGTRSLRRSSRRPPRRLAHHQRASFTSRCVRWNSRPS